jgi:peptidoglycan-associated lipoprotein
MRFASLLAVTLVSIVACSHAQPAPPPIPAQVMEQPAPAPAPEPVAEPAPVPAKLAAVSVYFDFDSAELVPAARAALQSLADLAQRGYAQSIRIEGNCDERGTREYNLALGQRRADAAKKYLTGLGVSANRILAISYGKERPRATGHDEESWKENRRDDVVPVSGQSSNMVSQASP